MTKEEIKLVKKINPNLRYCNICKNFIKCRESVDNTKELVFIHLCHREDIKNIAYTIYYD